MPSKWTPQRRAQHDPTNFGDPERRLFAVEDQADLDEAARRLNKVAHPTPIRDNLIKIAARLGLDPPLSWVAPHASFSATLPDNRTEVDGHAIYKDALLFRAGDYPEKGIEVTPEDLFVAVETFAAPIPGNVEHTDFLRGRAGEIRALRLDPSDPTLLRGDVAIPLNLDSVLSADEKKLSCEFGVADRTLEGFALCVKPHIAGAALISSFAASDQPADASLLGGLADADLDRILATFASMQKTSHGQSSLQDLHDMAARSGAACRMDRARSAFTAPRERTAFQKIHDLCTEHGASCRVSTRNPLSPFSADRPEGKPMSWKTKLKKALFGDQADEITADFDESITEDRVAGILGGPPEPKPETPPAAPAKFSDSPEYRAMKAELDRQAAQNDALFTSSATADADRFVLDLVRSGRAMPVEAANLKADFVSAAKLDRAHPEAKVALFSADGKESQVSYLDRFKATQGMRPQAFAAFSREGAPSDFAGSLSAVPSGSSGYDPEAHAAEINKAHFGAPRSN